jgi:serine/threonine protein kinase
MVKTKKNNNKLKKNQKGGRHLDKYGLIGQGTFGCTYKPPLKCDETTGICSPGNNDKRCRGISKLQSYNYSRKESRNTTALDLLEFDMDHRYHYPSPLLCSKSNISEYLISSGRGGRCNLSPDISNPHLLLYSYGGLDFSMVLSEPDYLIDPRSVFGENGLKKILGGIALLLSKNLVHVDIKENNIVTGQIAFTSIQGNNSNLQERFIQDFTDYRFIDFGMLSLISREGLTNSINEQTAYSYLDILSPSRDGSQPSRITQSNLSAIHKYYPIYGIFIGKTYDEIYQMNQTTITNRVNAFFKSPIIQPIISYYSYKYRETNPARLRTAINESLNTLLTYLQNPDLFYSVQIALIKCLDLYAFGVMLFNCYIHYRTYINSPYDTYLKDPLFKIVPEKITKFLKNTQLLSENPININGTTVESIDVNAVLANFNDIFAPFQR